MVEELLSSESRPAQLCRRHNISSSLLYHWKRLMLDNPPTETYNLGN
ncbi:MAG: transposase [Chloroflexi bacterium]|nr:transposase [Chloroflexota bacterium]